ncbi:hypothetical protein RhiLY_01844 [Ceratobasidium sp. AG-Ba]|nr:hypothetical protein RhiLY_01844 [Ceratobasidium sp. AG-Ba]
MEWHSNGIAYLHTTSPVQLPDLVAIFGQTSLQYPLLKIAQHTEMQHNTHVCNPWATKASSEGSSGKEDHQEMSREDWNTMLGALRKCPNCSAYVAIEGGQCHEPAPDM